MHVVCSILILLQVVVGSFCDSSGGINYYNLFFKLPLPSGSHTVEVGQMLVLDCEAGGSPAPTIHWLHDGRRIAQGDDVRSENEVTWEDKEATISMETLRLGTTRSRLFIDCVTPKTHGQYSCVATAGGQHITSTTKLSTELPKKSVDMPFSCLLQKRSTNAASPARVYMWTAQRLEFEGGDVQLFCRGDGRPTPKVSWYDQEGNVIRTGKQYRKLANGDLLIHQVNWLDNMGVYTCVAENPYGKDMVETFLYPTTP